MEYGSISVRVLTEQLKIIEKAAEKSGVSVASYVRRYAIAAACKDLGLPMPDLTALERRVRSPVAKVAAMAGIPREKLERAWINRLAEMALRDPKTMEELKHLTDDDEPPSDRSARQARSDVSALTPPPTAPIIRRRKAH